MKSIERCIKILEESGDSVKLTTRAREELDFLHRKLDKLKTIESVYDFEYKGGRYCRQHTDIKK